MFLVSLCLLLVAIKNQPAGRALTSHWSLNALTMVVYENIFNGALDGALWPNFKKKFSWTTILKLFRNKSEVSTLLVGEMTSNDQ